MFMTATVQPVPHLDFNCKIFMERLLLTRFITSATAHSNFCDDALVNEAIKHREWRDIISSTDATVGNIIEDIAESFNLDEYIIDRLEVSYRTKIGSNYNTPNVKLEDGDIFSSIMIRIDDDKNIPPRPLIITDLNIQARNQIGDLVEED